MNSSNDVASLAGRILMSVICIFAGIGKVAGFSATVGYAASVGVPLPQVAISIAIIVELLGGLALLVGFQTRIVAWIIFLYMIPIFYFLPEFLGSGRRRANE